jgi:hypothetical protein
VVLFESGAIVLHVARASAALLPTDQEGRARATAWVFAAPNSVEPFIMGLVDVDIFSREAPSAKESRPHKEAMVKKRLSDLAERLTGRDWLEDRLGLSPADAEPGFQPRGSLRDFSRDRAMNRRLSRYANIAPSTSTAIALRHRTRFSVAIGRLDHPSLGDNLLAVPIAVVQEQLAELRKVDRAGVQQHICQLQLVLIAVDAPGCGILHPRRLPDSFLQVFAESLMRDSFQDQAKQQGVLVVVVKALEARRSKHSRTHCPVNLGDLDD